MCASLRTNSAYCIQVALMPSLQSGIVRKNATACGVVVLVSQEATQPLVIAPTRYGMRLEDPAAASRSHAPQTREGQIRAALRHRRILHCDGSNWRSSRRVTCLTSERDQAHVDLS